MGKRSKVNRACFLDRDGVLNRAFVKGGKPYPPETLDQFEILPGVKEALFLLKKAGFLTIVVTNQPDVATQKQKREIVDAMHERLFQELPLDDLFACYEIDSPTCTCYKPKPGMLLSAAKKHSLLLKESYLIGDRWRDVGAGKAAGCTTFFIDYGYKESLVDTPDHICKNLFEAAQQIVRHRL